jgi:hypothetical protein
MSVTKCPDCNKVISKRFPLHKCKRIIRYHVVPASTLRGWFVKRVVLVDGRETDDGWRERCQTKAEAKTRKERLNKALGAGLISARVS